MSRDDDHDTPFVAPMERLEVDRMAIGQQVRELRRSRGITLSDLAQQLGRSIGNLSEIERGMSPVTIELLQDIAQTMGVTISWFFSGNAVAPLHERGVVVRRGNRRRLDLTGAGVSEELLSPGLDRRFIIIQTTLAPAGSTGDKHRVRKGEEAGVVLSGTLELHFEEQIHHLEAGDSFSLNGQGAHFCRNPGKTDTVILWVISPPNY